MMKLSNIFPKVQIEERIGKEITFTELDDYEKILELKSPSIFELGATVWDRYCSSSSCNHSPTLFANHFNNSDPSLLTEIGKLLNEQMFNQLYYAKIQLNDGLVADPTVAQLFICELWQQTLHISDVEFSNPYVPIALGTRLPGQKYKGLGLFQELLIQAESYCKKNDLQQVSLTAASLEHLRFFARYGFSPANTQMGSLGQKSGQSIPMVKNI
jgi:hypothetical protein